MKNFTQRFIGLFLLVFTMSFTLSTYGQDKIGNKMYLYGSIEGVIKGKTLVNYTFDDPKGIAKTVKAFKGIGVDASNWYSVFMPGTEYTDMEINSILIEKGIETIIKIKHKGTSMSQKKKTTFDESSVSTNEVTVVANVDLQFEVYSISNDFAKPLAVINCNANNTSGTYGSERTVIRKIVNRVVKKISSIK